VVVDQYGGRVFDDYEEADEFAQAVGYPGAGHLFTDASLPKEYDVQATTLLWSRVLPFCAAPPQ
jgi:dienelactone hydrolase